MDSPLHFSLSDIPDQFCSNFRPCLALIEFIEAVTNTAFDELVVGHPHDLAGTSFPFRAIIEFVEMSCEKPFEELIILHKEEFQNQKITLAQYIFEHYSAAIQERCEKRARRDSQIPVLLRQISEQQLTIDELQKSLKDREERLAVLESAISAETRSKYLGSTEVIGAMEGASHNTTDKSSSPPTRRRRSENRRRKSVRAHAYGFDGADETDGSGNTPQWSFFPSNRHSGSASAASSSRFGLGRGARSAYESSAPSTSQNLPRGRPAQSDYESSPSDRPAPRAYAPGLAMKQAKIDPYDPSQLFKPDDRYTLLEEKRDVRLRGTWSTIDPEDKKRTFDSRWYQERNSAQPPLSDASEPFWAGSKDQRGVDHSWSGAKSENSHQQVDERFENPYLDVDPDVRNKFLPISHVLREGIEPRSAFEQRNQRIVPKRTSAPVKVIIGGKPIKTLEQKADTRGELQDRFGDYIGENLGRMKKHLEEDRQAKIKLRDEEMVRATQEKRTWDAMDPEERETQKAKRKAPIDTFAPGPGAATCDIFDYAEMPDVYSKKVTAKDIASWSQSQSARSNRETTEPRFETDTSVSDLSQNRNFEPLSSGRTNSPQSRRRSDMTGSMAHSRRSVTTTHSSGRTEVPAFGPLSNRPTNSSQSMSRTDVTAAATPEAGAARFSEERSVSTQTRPGFKSLASVQSDKTPSIFERGPELKPVEDTSASINPPINTEKAELYKSSRIICSTRGRVVKVRLHEPVHYSASAVVSRVFGGIIQEIQFHPKERLALVIFAFPGEAESFVQHVKAVREKDGHAYRALQIDAEWMDGTEIKAIVPIQRKIYVLMIDEEARRVIKVNGIPLEKKKEELAEEMKLRLGKTLVNVAIVRDPKRYVREREGNMAIVEFVSIKDAIEAKALFKDGKIAGYERNPAGWLRDSCDRPAPKSPWCSCLNCKS